MPAGSKAKPKVVIDTNVFVSGLNFKGRPREFLDLIWKGNRIEKEAKNGGAKGKI